MFSSRAEGSILFPLHRPQVSDRFEAIVQQILPQFDKIIRSHLLFNILFWSLLIIQAVLIVVFLPVLLKSALMAIMIALFVLTLFAYLVIREYLTAQKAVKFDHLKHNFVEACNGVIQTGADKTLAGACTLLAEELHGREYTYFQAPSFLKMLNPVFEKISCKWHWKDVFYMQEVLLMQAVAEKIKQVKKEPTSLEAHAELAKAYIMLSGLYIDPKKVREKEEHRWIHPERVSEESARKFKESSEKAIEEFKIIKEYAPQDPWVNEQLAFSYHDLAMTKHEIEEYENILALKPQHVETLRKVGELYFILGHNGKGLKVYEQLRKLNPPLADEVIAYYGSVK